MRTGKALILPMILILLLAGIIIWWATLPPLVEVAAARPGTVAVALSATGSVKSVSEIKIGSELAAKVVAVSVDEGDVVRADQMMVLLDTQTLQAQADQAQAEVAAAQRSLESLRLNLPLEIRQAQAKLEEAKAALQGAEWTLRNAQEMYEQRTAAQQQVDQARAAVEIAKAELTAVEAALQEAGKRQSRAKNLLQEGAISRQEKEAIDAQYQTTEAARDSQAAKLKGAEAVLSNARKLYQERTAARQRVDAARSQLSQAKAAQQAAQAALDQLRGPRQRTIQAAQARVQAAQAARDQISVQLNKATIRSPVDGIVVHRLVEPGEVVAPGRPLLLLSVAGRMEAKVAVDETKIAAVRVGGRARMVADAFPKETFSGRVTEIAPSASEQEGTIEVTIILEDPHHHLKPGMTIEATIMGAQSPGGILVPTAALQRSEGQTSVLVVENGRARKRRVTVGFLGETEAEVASGLAPGNLVIITNLDKVQQGDRVRIRHEKL